MAGRQLDTEPFPLGVNDGVQLETVNQPIEVLPRATMFLKIGWRGMRLLSQTLSDVASAIEIPSHSPLSVSNKAASGAAQRGQEFHAAIVAGKLGEFGAQVLPDVVEIKTLERPEAQLMEQNRQRHQLRQSQPASSFALFHPRCQEALFPRRFKPLAKIVDQTKKFG